MTAPHASESWQEILRRRLPFLGHRNWIVVADAAYPLQTSPGIETVLAEGRLNLVLSTVLDAVKASGHVRPVVHVDAELALLPEAHAPGIEALRSQINQAIASVPVRRLPHDDIIAKLDAAGRSFNILLIKTRELLPYTSVFIELDCGYWSAEAESALRNSLKLGAK